MPSRAVGDQVVDQGVLAVVVAADRGADPPPGPGADVGDDAELGLGAARGHPERIGQLVVAEQFRRRAIEGGSHGPPGLRGRHEHGKMAGQRSSCPGRFPISAPHVLPGASFSPGTATPGRRTVASLWPIRHQLPDNRTRADISPGS